MTGNFSLKWKDYRENLALTIKQLNSDVEFSDVTLVGEDHQLLPAHKIILSAARPVLQRGAQAAQDSPASDLHERHQGSRFGRSDAVSVLRRGRNLGREH